MCKDQTRKFAWPTCSNYIIIALIAQTQANALFPRFVKFA